MVGTRLVTFAFHTQDSVREAKARIMEILGSRGILTETGSDLTPFCIAGTDEHILMWSRYPMYVPEGAVFAGNKICQHNSLWISCR